MASLPEKGGKLITNTQQINPMPVITGAASYPDNIIEKLKASGANATAKDALSAAEEAGSSKAVNVVLMGLLSKSMEFEEEVWEKAIEECVPPKALEINKKAFAIGRSL